MLCKDSPHHAHRGFAEAIGATVVSFQGLSPPFSGTVVEDIRHGLRPVPTDYDVYLVEGSSDLYLLSQLGLRTDSTIIYLSDDHRLFGLDAYRFDSWGPKDVSKRLDRHIDLAFIRRLADKYVDGVIAGSTLTAEYTSSAIESEIPARVANPYIDPNVLDRLKTAEPSLSSNVAVTVGISRDHKGVDRLVDIWPTVRQSIPDAKLYIVGPGYPEAYADVSGVHLTGYVEPQNLDGILREASLYVHPARVEAFGVTVVEAMSAGLPAVVTETTGARTAVEQIDKHAVVESTGNAIAESVVAHFEKPTSEKSDISKRARSVGTTYSEENMKSNFRRTFNDLLNLIN